jgi:MFS family permease
VGCVALAYPASNESWRIHFLIGASPALITLLIRLFVPESEKWKKASEQATQTGQPASRIIEVFQPPYRRATIGGILLVSVVLIGTWGAVQWIPLWVTELAGPANTRAKAYAMVLVSSGACVGTACAPILLARFTRRRGYQLLCLAAVLMSFWIFRTPATWGPLLWLKIFLLGCTATAFYGFFPLYLPELFPTKIRATGQGICYNTGRMVAVPFVLLSGELVKWVGGYQQAAAVITLIYLAGLVFAFFAHETSGQTLAE